ncbi:hypothetical protein K501DRAFT_291737 [Backusella circina FSU 941]|nr:hypothetical protein K501DRAFT_291737 [Backusella circina FSU 941]
MSKSLDNLVYIDDYLDIIEALPIDLQKNFTLLKEMDGYAQDSTSATAKAAIELIDNIDDLDPVDRFIKLKDMVDLLTESARRSSEKAALAKVTLNAVDRHCNRLDANLVKFEENQALGQVRIVAQPGLAPSSKSLRNYSNLSSKEKISKKINDKRESQSAKKRRAKDDLNMPRVLKETRNRTSHSEKGKPMKTLPIRKNGKVKSSDTDASIDPNEPLYCYCQQVSYGEMVGCDNSDVSIT